jgi:hypothetical protein
MDGEEADAALNHIAAKLRESNDLMDARSMGFWVASMLQEPEQPFSHDIGEDACRESCPACAWRLLTGNNEGSDL